MIKLTEVDRNNFDQEVLLSKLPVLVDFGAEWCRYCPKQLDILNNLPQEILNQINLCKVDIDNIPEIAAQYDVRGVPSILLFKEGLLIDRLVGVSTVEKIKDLLKKVEVIYVK